MSAEARPEKGLGRLVLQLLVAFVCYGLVAVLSHVPMGKEDVEAALLRLALKTREGTARVCRELTEAELAEVPIHMQKSETCTEFAIPYRLQVEIDGEVRIDRIDRASGVRGDRPLVLGEDLALTAGSHAVRLEMAPTGSAAEEGVHEEDWRRAMEVAPTYRFDDNLVAPAGRVVLLALDERSGEVRLRTSE